MKKEASKISGIVKAINKPEKVSLNRHLYTDAERQLFNISLSVYQFLSDARKDEANSVKARKKCRSLLESGKTLEARIAAKEALEARGKAFACSAVAKRIDWLVNKLNEDGFKPEIELPLKALDDAVLANDLWRAKRIINVIMTEIEKVEAPDIPESPTDKEITQYLKQVKEEITILNRLKGNNKVNEESSDAFSYSGFEETDLGAGSDVSSIVSCASRMRILNQNKPIRTRKRFRVTERSAYE